MLCRVKILGQEKTQGNPGTRRAAERHKSVSHLGELKFGIVYHYEVHTHLFYIFRKYMQLREIIFHGGSFHTV